jgi:hypothetical protein
MDDSARYLEAPPILAAISAGSVVVHGAHHDLFRPGTIYQGAYPDGRLLWLTRRAARELYPFAAVQHGLRAELAISPEGLDSFLTQAITVGMTRFPDRRRLELLAALGVDYLLLDRELAPEARAEVREVASDENFGQSVRLYEILERAGEVEIATRIVRAPQMNAALEAIFAPDFDPRTTVIVPGSGEGEASASLPPPVSDPPPSARLRASSREEVVVDAEAPVEAVLSLRRAYLPIWQVEVDGRAARTVITQMAHLGVALPPGRHAVRFWIDRRPLAAGYALAALGAVVLGLLAFGAGGSILTSAAKR